MMTSRRVPLPVSREQGESLVIPLSPPSPPHLPPLPIPRNERFERRSTICCCWLAGRLHVKCRRPREASMASMEKNEGPTFTTLCRVRPFPTLLLGRLRARPHSADAAGSRVLCSLGMVPHTPHTTPPTLNPEHPGKGPHCGPHLADAICVQASRVSHASTRPGWDSAGGGW